VPSPGVALDRLGFLTIGLFDGDNPGPGHETTLEIIELGERLGFDSAWVQDRRRGPLAGSALRGRQSPPSRLDQVLG